MRRANAPQPTRTRRAGPVLRMAAFLIAAAYGAGAVCATPAPIAISQVPLTVSIPAHPQVVFLIGNSQSMEGTLAGAIMTGAGSLGASVSLLQNESSPVNYTVPSGFTPPLNVGSGGQAPYTVTSASLTCSAGGLCTCPAGDECDNSASRMNVAKAAIWNVISEFMPDTDFALISYCSQGSTTTTCSQADVGEYMTWQYVMSPTTSGFVFTNTQIAGDTYIANPCYGYFTSLPTTNSVYEDCHALRTSGVIELTDAVLSGSQWMQVSDTSDDPLINDVLYAPNNWAAPLCLVYGGPNPANPWPPNYSLAQYNAAFTNVHVAYTSEVNACATETFPTNAGYVPYTPQTMYIERGFGYDNGNDQIYNPGGTYWAPVVKMTSAGQAPTPTSVATALAHFSPLLAPETNSGATGELKAVAEQSPIAGLIKNAQNYYSIANPASSVAGCSIQRYVILLTDGLPTQDLGGHSWPPPGTTAASEYGVTVSFNADGSLNSGATNDQAVLDTINTLTSMSTAATNPQKTYVIGIGSGVSSNPMAASVLTAMALAGGTQQYYPALNAVQLEQALQSILDDIQAATQSVSSSAINSTGLHVGSVVYQAQFTTKDTNQDWTGNLFAFPISPTTGYVDTNPTDAVWSAQAQLDAQSWQATSSGRLIATWDPVAGAGIPFEWSSGTPSTGIASSTTLGQDLQSNPSDTNGQDALNYLRGDRQLEQLQGGPYRTRTHVLADIVDSAPIYIGAPAGPSQTSSYAAFVAEYLNRPPVIYVGANDGMLHAIDAATGYERFAYIPHGVYGNLINLTYPTYNESHQFFVDGSPQASDVQFSDGSWHTVLVSGESAGGTSIFALDVTNPGAMTTEASIASNVLWEFTDANLGDTFSAPQFAITNAGTLLFFGNGYDSSTEQPYIYAVNPQNGALIAKINLCAAVPTACSASTPNGLSTIQTASSSGSVAGPANVLYAGDLQGNVWRVDISNTNPSSWVVSVLYQATDSGGNPQPITTQPQVSLNPDFPRLQGTMVFVGTGELLSNTDLSSTQVESMYGLYDAMPNGSTTTETNLVEQSLTAESVTTASGSQVDAFTITSNPLTLPSKMGWYVNFSLHPGERIVTDPALYGGMVLITTNQPSVSNCVTSTDSWFYVLNYLDGGSFPGPVFDVTESGSVTSSEPNVAGAFLGNVYSSAVRVISGNLGGGTASEDILINQSGQSTVSGAYTGSGTGSTGGGVTPPPLCAGGAATCGDPILNALLRGGGQSRTAWWEIR
ncbi:MAG TPA: PilC/PilY family type IV pilus protein [Steroidobacteraceae bacterium]|nr:PilC/PilY family type IV pilus protein [Steroidobacteraceae bacterium]